jgi:hypothetical protein
VRCSLGHTSTETTPLCALLDEQVADTQVCAAAAATR